MNILFTFVFIVKIATQWFFFVQQNFSKFFWKKITSFLFAEGAILIQTPKRDLYNRKKSGHNKFSFLNLNSNVLFFSHITIHFKFVASVLNLFFEVFLKRSFQSCCFIFFMRNYDNVVFRKSSK